MREDLTYGVEVSADEDKKKIFFDIPDDTTDKHHSHTRSAFLLHIHGRVKRTSLPSVLQKNGVKKIPGSVDSVIWFGLKFPLGVHIKGDFILAKPSV